LVVPDEVSLAARGELCNYGAEMVQHGCERTANDQEGEPMARSGAERATERQVVAERITIGLIPKVIAELERLQLETGMSKTDLVNRAISLSAYVTEQTAAGKDLLLRDSSGEIERLHLL